MNTYTKLKVTGGGAVNYNGIVSVFPKISLMGKERK